LGPDAALVLRLRVAAVSAVARPGGELLAPAPATDWSSLRSGGFGNCSRLPAVEALFAANRLPLRL